MITACRRAWARVEGWSQDGPGRGTAAPEESAGLSDAPRVVRPHSGPPQRVRDFEFRVTAVLEGDLSPERDPRLALLEPAPAGIVEKSRLGVSPAHGVAESKAPFRFTTGPEPSLRLPPGSRGPWKSSRNGDFLPAQYQVRPPPCCPVETV